MYSLLKFTLPHTLYIVWLYHLQFFSVSHFTLYIVTLYHMHSSFMSHFNLFHKLSWLCGIWHDMLVELMGKGGQLNSN